MKTRYDLLIVGGGVNGASIARDAAGRGLDVLLVERDDLAQATSSASSKLIHGGLRYLEQYKFRLVREALEEREILLRTAPHIVLSNAFRAAPSRGHASGLADTGLGSGSTIGSAGGGRCLAANASISPIRPGTAASKSMPNPALPIPICAVDDSRLVVLAAVDAARHGAEILTRTRLTALKRNAEDWIATLSDPSRSPIEITARAVVNAAGPWADHVRASVDGAKVPRRLRLVKGSHIVVPRLYRGDHAFILSHDDGRVVFAIPLCRAIQPDRHDRCRRRETRRQRTHRAPKRPPICAM